MAKYISKIKTFVDEKTGEKYENMHLIMQDFDIKPFIKLFPEIITPLGRKYTTIMEVPILLNLILTMNELNKIKITQNEIANRFDIAKKSVNTALQELKRKGLLKYKRSIIFINPQCACRCSKNIRKQLINEYLCNWE